MHSVMQMYPPPPAVSVLFNEPKLLKSHLVHHNAPVLSGFSALQRAEIAEIASPYLSAFTKSSVSVLFNEPKLLKCYPQSSLPPPAVRFSALQRAEIAEIESLNVD